MNSVADRVRQIVVEELAVADYCVAPFSRLDALGAGPRRVTREEGP